MGQSTRNYSQAQRANFASYIQELYQHSADLAEYAEMRVRGDLPIGNGYLIGETDPDWWLSFAAECRSERDAYHRVIRLARTLLGSTIPARDGDWTVGYHIYLKEFVNEGRDKPLNSG